MKKGLTTIAVIAAFIAGLVFYGAGDLLLPPAASGKTGTDPGQTPLIIAHRGLSSAAPESTAASYQKALEAGAQILEGDIQRSRDNVLFVFHDDDFSRTTNIADVFPGREADPAGSFTWEEISKLEMGTWFNESHPEAADDAFFGEAVITLDELAALAGADPQSVTLYLETKSQELYPGIEKELVDFLTKRGWAGRDSGSRKTVIFQSFSPESLARFKELAPGIERTLLLSGTLIYQPRQRRVALAQAQLVADGTGPHSMICTAPFVARAQQKGLYVHCYTINDPEQALKLADRGVAGLFTDKADLLAAAFRED